MMASSDHAPDLPFVSVLLPALNCVGEVDAFVRAIRRQSYPPDRFEVVVADNGSTDGTRDRLDMYAIRSVACPERGRSRALNAGLRVTRGDIICTTDMSCQPEPDWIERLVEGFQDPTVGCIAGEIRLLPSQPTIALRFQERSNYMSPLCAATRRSLPYLPFADGANASFRRTLFDAIGPFDEAFFKAADVEICYRMFVATPYRLLFCRDAVVWESGEPTLRALLKQRFRIGMGANLLIAKYPLFFAQRSDNMPLLKRAYWRGAAALRRLFEQPASTAGARERLEDGMVRMLMSLAQAMGLGYGRWYMRRKGIRPARISDDQARAFVSAMTSFGQRVTLR